jgi:hypothetical protein
MKNNVKHAMKAKEKKLCSKNHNIWL